MCTELIGSTTPRKARGVQIDDDSVLLMVLNIPVLNGRQSGRRVPQ